MIIVKPFVNTGSEARLPAPALSFTRLELLVSIVSVVLLVLLLLAWHARSRDLPQRAVCQENLKQLSVGFGAYAYDVGRLPTAARRGSPTSNDWIFWQSQR